MIKNYLLITFRNLLKNKLFIIVNVLGMGFAIAVCVVAYVNWDFADKWDSTQANADKIYRVQFWSESPGSMTRFGCVPLPMGALVQQNIKDVTPVRYSTQWHDFRIKDELFATEIAYVDSTFFDVFTCELKYGVATDLGDKSRIFISDETARKYFNREDVVGEPLTQVYTDAKGDRSRKEFIIGGVFKKMPENSSFRFGVLTQFDNMWDIRSEAGFEETNWKYWSTLFLKIDDPSRVPAVTTQLQRYVEPQNKAREDLKVKEYYLENLSGMMKRNREEPRTNNDFLAESVPGQAITVPNVMAVLLMLLACFNFTNTSVAISSKRLKEIGVRKVMGGMRFQLVLQFLGENLLLCFLAMVVGLMLAEWLVPAYDSLWPWITLELSYSDNAGFLMFLAGLLVVTALIAGGYPSFYVTSFEPVSILKGKARFGGTNWFTRILLGGQFVISLLSIIMGVAFYMNGQFQKNYDLGFSTTGVITAWVGSEGAFNTFRDAVASNPDIKVVAGTKHHVSNWFNGGNPVKYGSETYKIDIIETGDEYFDAMGMTLLAGRKFQKNSETDRKESVLVTEELVKQLKWTDDPIGKRLTINDTTQLFVIGVVKDIYSRQLWEPLQPVMLRYIAPADYEQVVVSTDPSKVYEVNEYMKTKWKEVFPNMMYSGRATDPSLEESAQINDNVVIMFGFLGFFATLMTGIGLYTLVSLNIVKRMKEIGVRKVLGASTFNLAGVINAEFIINLGVATIIGGALGYLGANWLMDSIWKIYLPLNFVSLFFSIFALVTIAVLAVGYKTIATANLNPTKTLRDE